MRTAGARLAVKDGKRVRGGHELAAHVGAQRQPERRRGLFQRPGAQPRLDPNGHARPAPAGRRHLRGQGRRVPGGRRCALPHDRQEHLVPQLGPGRVKPKLAPNAAPRRAAPVHYSVQQLPVRRRDCYVGVEYMKGRRGCGWAMF